MGERMVEAEAQNVVIKVPMKQASWVPKTNIGGQW
jgi:hypothetical protein